MPSIWLAKKHKKQTAVSNEAGQQYDLSATTKALGDLGVGIELYFVFNKVITIVLAIMSFISIPLIVVNTSGNQVPKFDRKTGFEVTTIGNQGNYVSNGTTYVEVIGQTFKQADVTFFTSLIDVGYCCCFITFLLIFRMREKAIVQKNDETHITPADYAVEITRLPAEGVTADSLVKHFQPFGRVVEAFVARKYNGVISKYKQKFHLKKKLEKTRITFDREDKKTLKLRRQMSRLEAEIAAANPERKHMDELPCVRGFIVFDSQGNQQQCLKAYEWSRSWLGRLMMSSELKYRGIHAISVNQAPEPSNILWENLEISDTERFARRCFTNFLSFVLLLFSFVAIYGTYLEQNNLAASVSCTTFEQNATYAAYFQDLDADTNDTYTGYPEALKSCWCQARGFSTALAKYRSFCNSWLIKVIETQFITIVSGMGIVLVNYLLKALLKVLAKFEKHPSRTLMLREMMLKVFTTQFVNTAVIVLIVNAKFETTGSVEAQVVFKGDHSGFDRQWYTTVGSSILIWMIINSVALPAVQIAMVVFEWCIRRAKTSKVATQEELNRLYRGSKFDIASRYAENLNSVFVALLYSTGIPVLLPFATFYSLLSYWTDKYILIRHSRKPPSYDQRMSELVTWLMPTAIILHGCFGIWMLGSTQTIQSELLDGDLADGADTIVDGDASTAGGSIPLGNKIMRKSGFPLFLMVITVGMAFVISSTAFKWIKHVVCCCFADSTMYKTESQIDDNVKYSTEVARMRKTGLASYDIRNNPNYRASISAFEIL